MAELSYIERNSVELFLEMKSGYVMNFSDRTFKEFVYDAVGLDIHDLKYHYASNSKANRLRQFFKVESNFVVGRLLKAFCEYWLSRVQNGEIDYIDDENVYKETLRISEKLIAHNVIQHLDSLKPNSNDKDFELLASSIKDSIEKNQPEPALDRLHTFVIKYLRQLCENHCIPFTKDDSANALYGKYSKFLVRDKLVDSAMAEKILKFSISILDAFNDVRNNRSFAHDNPILNYDESILIFNNVANTIRFIERIEAKNKIQLPDNSFDELPF